MWLGVAGNIALWACAILSISTIIAYAVSLFRPADNRLKLASRALYAGTAVTHIAAFACLLAIVYNKTIGGVYRFEYAFSHTSNDLQGFYRLAATWAGQEGSFLLWGFWTAIIGLLVIARAGKYEARVMPFYTTVLTFLAAILLMQSPFKLIPGLTAEQMAGHAGLSQFPREGQGLNALLQNYWMTIHPPTIFFGFASLAVPFCYAIAALIWKDYHGWTARVMPYALLTCLTLGVGLFMGGYWAYETQGWHGFWGWDPVENASFFPWLAVTALVHGLVVQKDRGGMAKTNTFLGLLGFWLFLLGTFLTRSGALSGKDEQTGQMLSVHAFDSIAKSGLILMVVMMAAYGIVGLALWLWRFRSIPFRKTTGDSLLSRDFAFFLAVLLMILACAIVTLGTTQPLILSWMHKPPAAVKPSFYNRAMMPMTLLSALAMGVVPWLAWRKTNPETFLKKMLAPWFLMLAFGFFMLFWVIGAQRDLQAIADPTDPAWLEKSQAWINPAVQRICVMALASLGFLVALSNSMLAYKVFRSRKPLAAGGWLAHVGIGIMMIGIIASNTFERTVRVTVEEKSAPTEAFGYKFEYEKQTGKAFETFPLNPDFDKKNTVQLRVTPPTSEGPSSDGSRTFVVEPRWFVDNLTTARSEADLMRIKWPFIRKYFGHDLYVALADNPQPKFPTVTLKKGVPKTAGPYTLLYANVTAGPGAMENSRSISASLLIKAPDGKIAQANPSMEVSPGADPSFQVASVGEIRDADNNPGAVYLRKANPDTGEAEFQLSLPEAKSTWVVPLEVTYKPWVNLVWTGIIIMAIGVLVAMLRRIGDANRADDAAAAAVVRGRNDSELDWQETNAVAAGAGAANGKNGNGHSVPQRAGKSGNGHATAPRNGNGNGRSRVAGAEGKNGIAAESSAEEKTPAQV